MAYGMSLDPDEYPTADELAAYEEPLPDYQLGPAEPMPPDYGGYPYPHVEPVQGPLDRIALALYGNVPNVPTQRYQGSPSGAAAAFLTGLAGGFANIRSKRISEREKLNQVLAQKAHDENMANLAATRAARAAGIITAAAAAQFGLPLSTVGKQISELTPEQQRMVRQEKAPGSEDVVTEADVKALPWLKPALGWKRSTAISAFHPKSAEAEPLLVIQTPTGPRYVRRSEAIGKEPGKAAPETKPPTPAERQQIVQDNNVIASIDKVRANFSPNFVGPGSELLSPTFRANPARAKFASQLAEWTSQAIHALYGGALTPTELARVRPQFPQMTDPPENFTAKLENAEERLRQKAMENRSVLSSTGVDISGVAPIPPMAKRSATNAPVRFKSKGKVYVITDPAKIAEARRRGYQEVR